MSVRASCFRAVLKITSFLRAKTKANAFLKSYVWQYLVLSFFKGKGLGEFGQTEKGLGEFGQTEKEMERH